MELTVGQLINGVWRPDGYATKSTDGAFKRKAASFRNWITADGSAGPSGESGFPAESGRYHLYVSYACPWAHRTLIFRALKGLEEHISISVVSPDALADGWTFETDKEGATGDTLYGLLFARDLYVKSMPDVSSRVTVPILWDKKREVIVSNESSEIIRMFNSAFDKITGNTLDFWPDKMRNDIEEVNARIYSDVNNGVYKAGFATTQSAYDAAVETLFDTLEWIENRLYTQRYLLGDRLTEADWRLFTTLVRFDPVYHLHFKCSYKRLIDYPNLWGFTRELFQMPNIAKTVNLDHIVRHYYYSLTSINPNRIVPMGPVLDFNQLHGREMLKAS